MTYSAVDLNDFITVISKSLNLFIFSNFKKYHSELKHDLYSAKEHSSKDFPFLAKL